MSHIAGNFGDGYYIDLQKDVTTTDWRWNGDGALLSAISYWANNAPAGQPGDLCATMMKTTNCNAVLN